MAARINYDKRILSWTFIWIGNCRGITIFGIFNAGGIFSKLVLEFYIPEEFFRLVSNVIFSNRKCNHQYWKLRIDKKISAGGTRTKDQLGVDQTLTTGLRIQ